MKVAVQAWQQRLHCIMRSHVVGGLADGPQGPTSLRLPGGPPSGEAPAECKGCGGGFGIQLGSPHLTHPQGLRSLPLEFVSRVSLGLFLPLLLGAAIEVSSGGSPGFNFCPLQAFLPTQHPEGASKNASVLLLRSFLGEGQSPTSESTRPWVISLPTSPRLSCSPSCYCSPATWASSSSFYALNV